VEDKIFSNIFMGWLVNTNFQIGCNFRNRETNNTYINVSYVTNKYLYHKDKIDNLFFLYGLMIKSINKAVPLLLEYDYRSGNKTEDQMTYKYTKEIFRYELLNIDLIEESFKDIYSYFEKFTNSQKISELIIRFRNISSIIDCVTCSKCRMHAKLEVFGIATMLKIVFTPSTEELKKSMSRNELVAFINLFAKLSKSVSNVQLINDKIKQAHYDLNIKKVKCITSVSIIGVIFIFLGLNFINNDDSDDLNNNSKDKKKKKE
jgi:ERO1-like protein alpha